MNETSYIKFYKRIINKEFKGWTLLGIKNEFISTVHKKDYSRADIDEICEYLFKLNETI